MEDIEKNAYEQLLKGIELYVKKCINDANFDLTYNATIKKVNADNTYDIILNRIEYKNVRTIGGVCKQNEVVKVLIPQKQFSDMVILR